MFDISTETDEQDITKVILTMDVRTARQIGTSLAASAIQLCTYANEHSKIALNSQMVRIDKSLAERFDILAKELINEVGV